MSNSAPLTIAFIETRPVSAARALAAMDPGDAAAFLDMIPTRFISLAISKMGAWPASAVLIKMDQSSAAAALRELDYQEAAAIFRLIPKDVRSSLMNELPEKMRRAFETSLSFPEDTVGAHMTTAVMTLTRNHTVKDAIDQLGRSPSGGAEVIYAVDDQRRLAGAVTAAELLRHPGKTELGEVLDATIISVFARTRISAVADLDAWDDYALLPVVSRKRHLIGALSRKSARQTAYSPSRTEGLEGTSFVASMAEAFLASAIGLAQVLADGGASSHGSERQGDYS